MGRVVVMLSVTLDGFFEGPGADLSWHRVSEALHADMNDVLGASGGLLNGRRNWEMMSAYWPQLDPNEPPVAQEFAALWQRIPQHVFSTTLEQVGHGATLHRSLDVVPALRDAAAGDLFAGGGALAAGLAARGLVDRWVLNLVPVVLGAGTPLFAPGQRQDLQLVGQTTYDDGVVQLQYEPQR